MINLTDKKNQKGITLIGLLVSISIVAILLSVGIPSFSKMINKHRAVVVINSLDQSLIFARNKAFSDSKSVAMCSSENANSSNPTCSKKPDDWGKGWIIFKSVNNNKYYNKQEDTLLFSYKVDPPQSINMSSGKSVIKWNKFGFSSGSTNSYFELLYGDKKMCIYFESPFDISSRCP